MRATVYPPTRFVTTADGVRIAYSEIGSGRPLVFVRGINSHLEAMWDDGPTRAYFEALARRHRVVRLDARGNGLSDVRVDDITLDGLVEDVRAVVDDLELDDVILYGQGFGGPIAIAYAARHPDRVTDLVLFCSYADPTRIAPGLQRMSTLFRTAPDAAFAWLVFESYPTGDHVPVAKARTQAEILRPEVAAAMFDLVSRTDVTDLLGTVRARTLVLHPQGSRAVPLDLGRRIASGITGARFVRVPGGSYNPWGDDAAVTLRAIAEFLGEETDDDPAPDQDHDGVLATVLFTDIVESTRSLAEMGDRRWTDVLQQHGSVTREQVQRWGGRYVKDTGDGIMATFDTPGAAIRCAVGIRGALGPVGLHIRAGVHAGEVVLVADDVHGIAVHIAARVRDVAAAGEVLVSRTVVDLLAGSGVAFDERGEHELKGIPGRWGLFAVQP